MREAETDDASLSLEGTEQVTPIITRQNTSEQPSMEFRDLRDFYNTQVKDEGEEAGLTEFKALCKARQWPGLARVTEDIMKRLNTDQWNDDGGLYRPGLARYLKDHTWTASIPTVKPARSKKSEKQKTTLWDRQQAAFAEYDERMAKAGVPS